MDCRLLVQYDRKKLWVTSDGPEDWRDRKRNLKKKENVGRDMILEPYVLPILYQEVLLKKSD